MGAFFWGLAIGFAIGTILCGALLALIMEALNDDGFCHCLAVRKERTATDGICDTCGRVVNLLELDATRSVNILTEVKR